MFLEALGFPVLVADAHQSTQLSKKLGTNEAVMARFWPWLEPFSGRKPVNPCMPFLLRHLGCEGEGVQLTNPDMVCTRTVTIPGGFSTTGSDD